MFLDKENLISDQQDLAQVVGAYLSTYSIDFGAVGTPVLGGSLAADPGRAPGLDLLVQVVETFVGATMTMIVELVMADNAALTSNLVSLQQAPGASITVGIPVATLIAGYQFRLALPVGISKRYFGARYNILTATTTAGKITAGLCWSKQTNPTV